MRTHNVKKGKTGEELAVAFLERANHRIICRNFKRAPGEIDLISLDVETIVFIEVKYRSDLKYGYPREAVNRSKQKRITKTALWYLKENQLEDISVRFDVIEVYFEGNKELIINHFENAFGF